MVKAFLLCKNGLRPPPFLGGAHKKSSKTFIKMQLHCIFRKSVCTDLKAFHEREDVKHSLKEGLKQINLNFIFKSKIP